MKEKKKLNITFINPNTEEQIVQEIAGVVAYNLAENDEKVVFEYKNRKEIERDDEDKWKL